MSKTIEQQAEECVNRVSSGIPSLIPTRDELDAMKKNIRRELRQEITKVLQQRDHIAREEKEIHDFEMFFETLNEIRDMVDGTDSQLTEYLEEMIKSYNPALTQPNNSK